MKPKLDAIERLPLQKRSSIRTLAEGINCSKSTVGRWINDKHIKAHTNAIKPELSEVNKDSRLCFSLQALDVHMEKETANFKSMHNVVHIDEKFFYMTKACHRFYLTPTETEPHRTCKSKNYIPKIMFMCAISRPMWDNDGVLLFDGKIGIFPFTEEVPALRSSKNHAAGTLGTKAIQSVTREVIRACLINKVRTDFISEQGNVRKQFVPV